MSSQFSSPPASDEEDLKTSSRSSSPSVEDEDGSDSSSNAPQGPTYTPQEISEILLDFYQFLITMHYDAADLKMPPPEGWPNLTQETCGDFFSDYALEVMRHIPYFDQDPMTTTKAQVHYKSALVDYTYYPKEVFYDFFDYRDGIEFWNTEDVVDTRHVFILAQGHESSGRCLFLNAWDGEITEDMIRMNTLSPVDMRTFFDALKEDYRTLKLIPCRGREVLEIYDDVPETSEEITEQQVISQKDEWQTELDIQYIRQLYRHYGWPDHFQKEEAFKAINELVDAMPDRRVWWRL